MRVVLKNVPVELSPEVAQLLIRLGAAHEEESFGTPTHRGAPPATVRKPRKPSPDSKSKDTKLRSTQTGDLKDQARNGVERKSTRKG